MADKEALVFVIDVGKSMGEKRYGRAKNDLDWSLQYVWDKVSNIVYNGRKGQVIGVLAFRTDKTKNHMQDADGYEHITLVQSISQILMPQLQNLPKTLIPSNTNDGDALSAVILAVDMITKHCRHLKFTKKICLITNASGKIDSDDIDATAEQIKQNNIGLTVLGLDFDDAQFGYKEENKSHQKRQNEDHLRRLVDLSRGDFGTMQEAIEGLARPHVKSTRPTPTYKGQLLLGDPQNYDTAIAIDVERYFKVSVRRPPTASSFVTKEGTSQMDSENLSTVRNAYTYTVKDESEPNGRREIPREELAKGYEYGRTAVHISESDQNITKLETEAAYEILGFIPMDNVERYMMLENTNMLVAQKANDKAALALSSLIHALFELGSCAVARFVKKDMTDPLLTLLSPLVAEDIECLIENDLPFAEDIRQYRFPPLDKVVTVSGKTLNSHRNLPNDDVMSAMSDFVDNMTLTQGEERLAMDDTFSPMLHTIEGAIKYRAIHPNDEVQPKSESLLEISKQPVDLQEHSKPALDRLMKAADVKKVPPKAKGRRRYRDMEKPLSGLNVEELFKKESVKRKQISADNAIPEFKQLMDNVEEEEVVKDAVKQMFSIIENQVRNSFGSTKYEQAIACLGTARQEMIEMEMPELYNEALQRFKKDLQTEKLGGNRKEFWWKIRTKRVGLIDKSQSETSTVSKDDAFSFLQSWELNRT